MTRAGLTVTSTQTWPSATRLGSIEQFLDVELLPIADRIDDATRRRIAEDCHTALAPFTTPDGGIAAPIELLLAVAVPA